MSDDNIWGKQWSDADSPGDHADLLLNNIGFNNTKDENKTL